MQSDGRREAPSRHKPPLSPVLAVRLLDSNGKPEGGNVNVHGYASSDDEGGRRSQETSWLFPLI